MNKVDEFPIKKEKRKKKKKKDSRVQSVAHALVYGSDCAFLLFRK